MEQNRSSFFRKHQMTIDEAVKMNRDKVKKMTAGQAAKLIGCTAMTFYKVAEKHGIEFVRHPYKGNTTANTDRNKYAKMAAALGYSSEKEMLVDMYKNKKMIIKQMAAVLHLAQSTVAARLDVYDLKDRAKLRDRIVDPQQEQKGKKVRKCSKCGKETTNRLLCDSCFKRFSGE
jgi:hypothetical protein